MAKKETLEERSFHKELVTQMLTLATSGFGLVAALAWNETIQAIVAEFIEPRIPGSGIISKLIYALLITSLAVLITYQLSRLASHWENKNKGFTPILIVFLVVVICLSAGGFLIFQNSRSQSQTNPSPTPDQIACIQDAMVCPDGSFVGRTGPNCEFAACPTQESSSADTSNWKTYTNNKTKFSIKYPPDWPLIYGECGDCIDSIEFNKNYSSTPQLVQQTLNSSIATITVFQDERIISIEDYKQIYIKTNPSIGDVKNINIGGTQAISFRYLNGIEPLTIVNYVIVKDKFYYSFGLYGSQEVEKNRSGYIDLFNQILSTFKFLP